VCGRYASVSTPEQLAEHFSVDEIRTDSQGERYNVAPTLDVYSIIEKDGHRRLGTLRWGFVPHWAKQLKGAPSPINVRVETVHEKRMFASAFSKRRCILPADGFYEWQERESSPRKQPYFIRDPEGLPLAFAGIWTVWRDPAAGDDADPLFSCAIVTTAARGRMAEIHERMPVMLPPQLWETWLSAEPQEAEHLQATLAALGTPRLEAYTITDRVNHVRNDGPELIEPGELED
jgi:putative SOS response-associated peptidase YedK